MIALLAGVFAGSDPSREPTTVTATVTGNRKAGSPHPSTVNRTVPVKRSHARCCLFLLSDCPCLRARIGGFHSKEANVLPYERLAVYWLAEEYVAFIDYVLSR